MGEVTKGRIQVKRVYDEPGHQDGDRYLVDRVWPRGAKQTEVQLKDWLRDVAPSHGLRKWFNHDPRKWTEFQRRYSMELEARPELWESILAAAQKNPITLLFSARDTERNNAVALKTFLERKMTKTGSAKPRKVTLASARKVPGVSSG